MHVGVSKCGGNLCCEQSPLLTIYEKWSSARSFAKREIVLGGKNQDRRDKIYTMRKYHPLPFISNSLHTGSHCGKEQP